MILRGYKLMIFVLQKYYRMPRKSPVLITDQGLIPIPESLSGNILKIFRLLSFSPIEQKTYFIIKTFYILCLAFPNHMYTPAHFFKLFLMIIIPFYRSSKFIFPELNSAFWGISISTAFMPVPKAAMYENYGFVFRKDNIRFAWQIFSVNSKSVSHFMKK